MAVPGKKQIPQEKAAITCMYIDYVGAVGTDSSAVLLCTCFQCTAVVSLKIVQVV